MTTVEKTSRSVAWAGLEIVSLLVLSLVTLIFLARLLGPAEFGLAALALVTVQFLTMIVRSVFIDAIVQRERLEAAHLDSAFWAGLLAAVAFIGLCVWGAPWFGRAFGEPALAGVLVWTSLSLVFSGVDGVPMAILRRDLRMKELAIRSASAASPARWWASAWRSPTTACGRWSGSRSRWRPAPRSPPSGSPAGGRPAGCRART